MIIQIIDLDFIYINFYMYLSKSNIKLGTAFFNKVSGQNIFTDITSTINVFFPDITSTINVFIGILKSDSTKVFYNM